MENQNTNASSLSSLRREATFAPGVSGRAASISIVPDGLPHLRVRVVNGFAVVDAVNADVLFEESAIRELSTQLHHLVEEGCTRILLNFAGIRYMSSDVLATLAGLHQRVERAQGRLGLFGLGPVLRDMVRICRLERLFDIYADEGEALSHANATGDRQ